MSRTSSQPIVIPGWIKAVVAVVVLVAALLGYWKVPHWRDWVSSLMPSTQPAPSQPDSSNPPPAVDRPPPTISSETPDVTENHLERPASAVVPESAPPATSARTTIANQTIYNESGDEVFRGTVDVGPTLARIQAGQKLQFPNDGATFQNREGRLPRKPSGYYKEFVHPTPDLAGPGPQRIVMGEQGETYYTADHYRTFVRLDK